MYKLHCAIWPWVKRHTVFLVHITIDCLQYSYLLTSQLESQRVYWENKIVHLEKETAEEVTHGQAALVNGLC